MFFIKIREEIKELVQDKTMPMFSVLLVDDEKDFIRTLLKRLERRGIECEGVFCGMDAIERIKARKFDTVLLDMKLPDKDGNAVLLEIRKVRPETRVIILTGHASANDGREGLKNGAVDYLMKPLEFESLFEKLQIAGNKASTPADDRREK